MKQTRITTRHIFVLGIICGAISSQTRAQTTITYIHTDALGSPVAESDAFGNLVSESFYDPYGSSFIQGNGDQPGFAGHVSDTETGLIQMQQRYYDPELGVFLSIDPTTAYGNPIVQFHRYRYANNNPYTFIDPDGRDGDLHWTANNQVTYTVRYTVTGVPLPFTAEQINAQVARDFSGVVNIDGVDVTVTAEAIQVDAAGPNINTINVVPDTAGVTPSGRSQTNRIGGNLITVGAGGEDAATVETVSHELGGHGGGAGDQYAGGVGANGQVLTEDVPGSANVMKDLSGQPANSQSLGEIIRAPTNTNTCTRGVGAASGGC